MTPLNNLPGSIRAFATDLDKRRPRGPLRGRRPRRSPRPPGAETRTSHSSGHF